MPNTLMVGKARAAGVCWYRIAVPATGLGCDWTAYLGDPPELTYTTGTVAPRDWTSYEVVVVQQARGHRWLEHVRSLQRAGVTVLYEIDDYLHGIQKLAFHSFKDAFTKQDLREFELVMRACDGLIVSVPFLAQKYRALNPNVWVCPNGLDLGRYQLTRPPRRDGDDTVTIGWSGATGHLEVVTPWLKEIRAIMAERPNVRFMSVGQPFARLLEKEFGPERCVSVPFGALETYPAAMRSFDLAIAPAGKGHFWRGKSDLRYLEHGALGIPLVADPELYATIEDGVCGLHATTPAEARSAMLRLVDDASLRERLGAAARAYVESEREMSVTARAWATAIAEARSRSGAIAAA